ILEEEQIVARVHDRIAPYLARAWGSLADHPLVGEAVSRGMMASLALTPDKAARARFTSDPGTVGLICREYSFGNNLVMRHVGDRMIIAPPLVISEADIDELMTRARRTLDQTHAHLQREGMMAAAA
ncbi:MAG: aspartate aminotransferase family protein, partial [Rhodobacteraceae bacterium]